MAHDLVEDAATRFGPAFEWAVVGMGVVSLDGRFLRVNRALCELFDRSEQEMLRLTWRDVVHPDDVASTAQRLEALETGDERSHVMELRCVRADASVVWILLAFDLVRDAHGQPLYVFGQALDITDRKRREDATLAVTRDLLEEAQRIARLGTYEWDAATNTVTWSEEIVRMLGLDASQKSVALEDLIERIHPDDRGYLLIPEDERPLSGSMEWEVRIPQADGSVRWVLVRGRRYAEGGRLVRVVGTALDITDRKEAEQVVVRALEREREAVERLRDLDRAKDAFLTSISHELRTPLTAIAGYARLLEQAGDRLSPDERARFLERTVDNAVRLEKLLTDLLDVDRLSRGVLEPRRRPVRLRDVADAVVARSSLAQRHTVTVEHEDGTAADADPAWTERIVENLVSNVLKHTPEGTAVVVRTFVRDGCACLEVEDAGPGMAAEFRRVVFDRFAHRPSAPAHAPGVGVGLALVRQLAELQGGTVTVEDGDGGGALFRVLLPPADT